jgi:oxygen-independent coproporphyrinogen-3 oxidase
MNSNSAGPAPLGVYIHVPFCKHACPYCDFYKIELRDRPARDRLDFPWLLAREAALLLAAHPGLDARPLETVYLGGGTPTTLVPSAVGNLLAALAALFGGPPAEATIEANPENLTPARARQWRAAGFNRLSIGVQSFRPADLALLERLHAPETIHRAVANAREAGFDNLSLDLMFALPGQTLDDWLANLGAALALAPQHLSFYGLTYHEGTPFDEWRRTGRLDEADDELQAAMYRAGADRLEAAGYEHYEVSNFALPGHRSRHNQRYWTRADVLPLGPGAHGNLGALRWANPPDIDAWAAALRADRLPREPVETIAPDLAIAERLYALLRRREGIAAAAEPELHARCLRWWHAQPAATRAPWATATDDQFALRREGWLLMDAIIDAILRA